MTWEQHVSNRNTIPEEELRKCFGKHVAWSADGRSIVACGDDDLAARGLHAQRWDSDGSGAFAVASEVQDIGDGIRLLRHMVSVVPAPSGWSIRSEFGVEVEGVSLAEAVNAASELVLELKAFGVPKRFRCTNSE
jgi:hypothetical protein